MSARVFAESTDAQLLPRLVRLTPNLCAGAYSLMKIVPARHILRKAAQEGELGPDTLIAETTSGTFGLALAMQAALMRRRLVLVSDPVIDVHLHRRLTDLGAGVVICEQPAETGGYQEARLRALDDVLARHPDSFCPRQYSNPDNPAAYAVVAEQLIRGLGQIDCIVGPVGSGGSMCGTTRALRAAGCDAYAVGVDTTGSVLFGQPDAPRVVRGLGNSLMPPNLDHSIFDEVHWCDAAEIYRATRDLHRTHALFQGPTSGAAYLVAKWWAAAHPDANCVVILPDDGYRYQETVYNDQWLAQQGYLQHSTPREPAELPNATDAATGWSRFPWRRRPLSEVVSPRISLAR